MSQQNLAQHLHAFLAQSQFWAWSRLREYQQGELTRLLELARDHTAFYRERLAPLFRSDGAIDWSRWNEVPLLERGDLAAGNDATHVHAVPEGHGEVKSYTTSGSTGIPVTTRHTGLAAQAWRAALWRSQRWCGTDWSQPLVHWHHFGVNATPADPEKNFGPWGDSSFEGAALGRQYTVDRTLPVAWRLDHLDRHQARYLSVPALDAFAAGLEAEALALSAGIDTIFSFSIGAEPEHRALCRKVFGARIHELYSSKEAGYIAHSCPRGHGFHVNAEFCLVEILDERGTPCVPGEVGRVVVTPFLSTAQPLVRLVQGDLARQGPDPEAGACACGSHLPLISAIIGREYHMFEEPGGRRFVPMIPDVLRSGLRAKTWQFTQTAKDRIAVSYVPEGETSAVSEAETGRAIAALLPAPFILTFDPVRQIPMTAAGKYIKYVNAFRNVLA